MPKAKFKMKNLLLLLAVSCLSFTVSAQKRDNLTDKEDLQVREAQELDLRMKVFVKIVDRRFLALTDPNAAQNKQVQKDIDDWGDLRVGTSQEIYWDIQKTINEAILKLDDAAERDQKNPLFGKAVHILADACQKWLAPLKPALGRTSDEKEKGLILASIDYCNQVLEASAKVPKEEKKKKN
jgi:hypothetical protein